jgi:hypothetical protein
MGSETTPDKEKDSEWRVFMETLWKYRYVREEGDLTDELSEVMYDESQGIADIAIKLYFLAQIRAIERKTERVTADMIRKTAEVSLRSVQEPLHALRSGNRMLLQKYEDIQPIDLEGAVWQALRNIGTSGSEVSLQSTSPASVHSTHGEKGACREQDGTEAGQEKHTQISYLFRRVMKKQGEQDDQ